VTPSCPWKLSRFKRLREFSVLLSQVYNRPRPFETASWAGSALRTPSLSRLNNRTFPQA
jgi:hypothetical protein